MQPNWPSDEMLGVGNPTMSLGVVIESGMVGTELVPMSQIGADQLLWSGARLCPMY